MSFIEREEHRRSQFCGMLYCYLNQNLFWSNNTTLIVAVARDSRATQHLMTIIVDTTISDTKSPGLQLQVRALYV